MMHRIGVMQLIYSILFAHQGHGDTLHFQKGPYIWAWGLCIAKEVFIDGQHAVTKRLL